MSIENKDRTIVFPTGQMRLPSARERKPHDSVSREEAFANAKLLNNVDYLTEHFVDVDALYISTTSKDELIKTIRPLSPFGYGGLMVFASPRRLDISSAHGEEHQITPTKSIYDFSWEAQVSYFKQIFAALKAFHSISLPNHEGETHIPVAMENALCSVSTEKYHMGRTIALPHAHIMTASELWIDRNHKITSPFRRATEQRFLTNEQLFGEFQEFFLQESQFLGDSQPSLVHRDAAPYGYTLITKITLNDESKSAAPQLAQIMRAHHELYAQFITQYLQKLNRKNSFLLPQPSYRVLLYEQENYLRITISPVLIDSGGVIEASNIVIYRGPSVQSIYTESELEMFNQQMAAQYLLMCE